VGDCKRLAQRIANEETPEALQADVEPAKTDQRERIEAINALIESYIKQGRVGEAQIVAVELGGRNLSTEELLEACIKQGQLYHALNAIKLGGRSLSTEEIERLIKICIKEGYVLEAQRVAVELGGRSLSTEEIDALVEHWIKQEIVSISDALEAAELGASKEAIDAIVEFCIKQETEH